MGALAYIFHSFKCSTKLGDARANPRCGNKTTERIQIQEHEQTNRNKRTNKHRVTFFPQTTRSRVGEEIPTWWRIPHLQTLVLQSPHQENTPKSISTISTISTTTISGGYSREPTNKGHLTNVEAIGGS